MPPLPVVLLIATVILAAGLTIWLAAAFSGASALGVILPATCLIALLVRWRWK